ncbi:MAG: tetratricopeptide repeat protein [Methylobacter sp.]
MRMPENGVCLQCHGADKYDTDKHHFHTTGSAGSHCVDCHMPTKTYMVIDPRRDHSFRVPRPDLSARIGTPNSCTGCHSDKSAHWAANKVRQWYGHDPKGYQDYAETLHAVRSGAVGAKARVLTLLRDKDQPAIARATVATELGVWLSPELLPLLAEGLSDPDPRVRSAGLQALDSLPTEQRWAIAHDRLCDPVRSLRALAAATLAGTPIERIPPSEQSDFRLAADDYLGSLRLNADDPGAQVNLGNFHAARGELAEAERAYREALHLDPNRTSAYVNLADLFRQINRDNDAEVLLQEGLARQPQAAVLHHSVGLLQVRKENLDAALASLKKAVELAPEETQFRYVYAVALSSVGHIDEAWGVVEAGLKRTPGDPSLNALHSQLATDN